MRTRRIAAGAAVALLLASPGATLLLASPGALASPDPWEDTLARAVPAVVALRISGTRAFDTDPASVLAATGFVVDAERGLILTNRHVVRPGPVTAEATFLDHETVPVLPVYRDPVHDFGLFRYDPAAVRFMRPAEIRLSPERARVGAEVRVVGNDAGEKLSILSGILARLDRDAPIYGANGYNDFNTFYYQAASSTSGGSSGSPVLDVSGHAVALNAGGSRNASSSFFLPLERVVRALERIRAGEPVPRGTFQVVFQQRAFDELRRLGLARETETDARRRFPGGTGLLVVDEVVPGGPAAGVLQPGDVLLSVAGRPLRDFAALEALLDDAVGESLDLELERRGARERATLSVQDLHAITPAAYLEFGGGVLHPLSFQQARNHGVPISGVFVASPGYAFSRAGVPAGAVVTAVGGAPVSELAALEARLAAAPDGARVPVRWFALDRPRTPQVSVLPVDRRWYPMELCTRDDALGTWPCRPSPEAPPAPPIAPATTSFETSGPRAARELAPSLAFVEFEVPYKIDGAHGRGFSGSGLVVDAERGLVVVDRDTVPVSLGEVRVRFARSLSVPGRVVALHPEHGLAVVAYDPALLGDTPVRSARLEPEPLAPGDELYLVGFDASQRLVSRRTEVARIEEQAVPLPEPPRFREANLELVFTTESVTTVGGVLADDRGRVRALWSSVSKDVRGGADAFFAGVPIDLVEEMVAPLRAGQPLRWRSLGVELGTVSLADAAERGLAPEAAARLAEHDPERRRAVEVTRVAAGTPASGVLEPGDLLLSADGVPVTSYREVERAAQREAVELEVLRDGEARGLRVATLELDAIGTRRALLFAGALLQPVPYPVQLQRGVPPEGVYVVGRWYGSPVERHGLRATRRILAVSGTPTPDLDAFLAAVEDVPDRGSIQILAEDLDGKREVLTLELDLRFWPTRELRFAEGGWELLPASRGDAGAARGARLSDPERMRSSWLDGRAASPGTRSAAAERSERAGR